MKVSIQVDLAYEFLQPSDTLLAIEVIPGHGQNLLFDELNVQGVDWLEPVEGIDALGQRTWTHVEQFMTVNYRADVEILRAARSLHGLQPSALENLEPHVIPYLAPSRYCESDQFLDFVSQTFGTERTGDAIENMASWLKENITYDSAASDSNTSAVDTLQSRRGVCRDFSHLLISFVRALGVPARMVSVYAPDVDPPDFHAAVEVWLEDQWYFIDPLRFAHANEAAMVCVGRDATDISFLTVFGAANMVSQSVQVSRLAE